MGRPTPKLPAGLTVGDDRVRRCWWAGADSLYVRYHDTEWGRPVADDRRLFEKICLEGFQSGLSWLTILRKRENFRAAFKDCDFRRVAKFNGRTVRSLLTDAGIVRHRGKIESTINNARRAIELSAEFGSLARYFWQWEPTGKSRPQVLDFATLSGMASTMESLALSKDLRRRGWTFVGPTTIYAFMQAVGLVNDHLKGCAIRGQVESARRAFVRPSS